MAAEDLPYARRTRTYNSRLAQELGKWAETLPEGQGIHDALFRVYLMLRPVSLLPSFKRLLTPRCGR